MTRSARTSAAATINPHPLVRNAADATIFDSASMLNVKETNDPHRKLADMLSAFAPPSSIALRGASNLRCTLYG